MFWRGLVAACLIAAWTPALSADIAVPPVRVPLTKLDAAVNQQGTFVVERRHKIDSGGIDSGFELCAVTVEAPPTKGVIARGALFEVFRLAKSSTPGLFGSPGRPGGRTYTYLDIEDIVGVEQALTTALDFLAAVEGAKDVTAMATFVGRSLVSFGVRVDRGKVDVYIGIEGINGVMGVDAWGGKSPRERLEKMRAAFRKTREFFPAAEQ